MTGQFGRKPSKDRSLKNQELTAVVWNTYKIDNQVVPSYGLVRIFICELRKFFSGCYYDNYVIFDEEVFCDVDTEFFVRLRPILLFKCRV